MIGDRAIFVAPALAGSRHLFDCMTPVAPRAVHLEVASDVIGSHKGGQYTLLGSLDLAAVLPQLRWDPVHTNSAEDILFLLPPQRARPLPSPTQPLCSPQGRGRSHTRSGVSRSLERACAPPHGGLWNP